MTFENVTPGTKVAARWQQHQIAPRIQAFTLSLPHFSPPTPLSLRRYHWFSQAMVYLLKETWLFFASSKTIYFLSKIRWKNIGGNPLQWNRWRAYFFLSADALETLRLLIKNSSVTLLGFHLVLFTLLSKTLVPQSTQNTDRIILRPLIVKPRSVQHCPPL